MTEKGSVEKQSLQKSFSSTTAIQAAIIVCWINVCLCHMDSLGPRWIPESHAEEGKERLQAEWNRVGQKVKEGEKEREKERKEGRKRLFPGWPTQSREWFRDVRRQRPMVGNWVSGGGKTAGEC